jgi:hypothetical protein
VWYAVLLNDFVREKTKENERIILGDIGMDGIVALGKIVKNVDFKLLR